MTHNYSVEFLFQQSCGCQLGNLYHSTEYKDELTEKGLQILQSSPFKAMNEWKTRRRQRSCSAQKPRRSPWSWKAWKTTARREGKTASGKESSVFGPFLHSLPTPPLLAPNRQPTRPGELWSWPSFYSTD